MLHSDKQLSELLQQQCWTLIDKAVRLYDLPSHWLDILTVTTDLTGRSAGKIEFRMQGRQFICIRIRFSLQAARLDLPQMLQDTLPHEVAHLVVKLSPKRFSQTAHGCDWKQICMALGGNGDIYHSLPLSPARQQRRWRYIDSAGDEHLISTVRHNRIQQGHSYQVKHSGAALVASGLVVE